MEPKELNAGDACPNCSGELQIDPKQTPDALIAHRRPTALSAAGFLRYQDTVKQKAAEHGLIHKCKDCGYEARLPVEESATDQGDDQVETPAPAARQANGTRAARGRA